jgi:D-arginine dehydrogenase
VALSTPLPSSASVAIIGGGIAGLSAAYQLANMGVRNVVLLESERMLATHSSARNAAIFLPLEESLSAVWLAQRSRDLLDERLGTSWLSAQGVTLVSASEEALDELRFAARRFGVFHDRLGPPVLEHRFPLLQGGEARYGVHLPLGGVMDVHHVMTSIQKWAVSGGVRIFTGAQVDGFDFDGGKGARVLVAGGHVLKAERVVIAAGAWAARLGALAGVEAQLTPLRRHLVQLSGDNMPRWKTPTIWRIDDAVYYRPEAGGVLASPCDETPWEPGVPKTDVEEVINLQYKLSTLAPSLSNASVKRVWACLRTMTNDRELVVGEDPRLKGLFWLAGLGGRGMTCAVAAGELLARTMLGMPHPLARTLTPNRLV